VPAVIAHKRPTLKRNHGPELAAQDAIGTTNYCRGHLLPPHMYEGRWSPRRSGIAPGAHSRSQSFCLCRTTRGVARESEEGFTVEGEFLTKKSQQAVAGVLQARVNLPHLKRSVAGPKVSIEQFRGLLRCAGSFDLVQGSTNLLVEGAIRIWNLARSLYSIWRAKLFRDSHSSLRIA
jgi:hypothetical protein